MATIRRRDVLKTAATMAAGGAMPAYAQGAGQISKLAGAFELAPGEIIYSGTPENVGPVVRGDIMDAPIDGLPAIRLNVV